jgi:hypothetical protein
MAKRRKQEWVIGDVFLVPLADGTYSVGQVVAQVKEALNSVVCVFSMTRIEDESQRVLLNSNEIISAVFTTTDLLDSGDWLVIGNRPPVSVGDFFDMEYLRSEGFLGVKIIGSGVVIKFMDACFGLYPWDGFYESDYLDKLLLSPDKNLMA